MQCILLRNTSATDSSDHFPYDTSGFQNVDNATYMFFRTPVSRTCRACYEASTLTQSCAG